jgi:predicted RecB family nuclease
MRLTASEILGLHRPSLCPLRVYLRQHGVEESEPGAFDQILETLGERHELGHLATLGPYEDLRAVPVEQRARRTAEALRRRVPIIYQGELVADTDFCEVPVPIVGRPDFLICDGDGYLRFVAVAVDGEGLALPHQRQVRNHRPRGTFEEKASLSTI